MDVMTGNNVAANAVGSAAFSPSIPIDKAGSISKHFRDAAGIVWIDGDPNVQVVGRPTISVVHDGVSAEQKISNSPAFRQL